MTCSHNLGLPYHLQPTDAGTRPLQRISAPTAQQVLRTQAFLIECQWRSHRYFADIPSAPFPSTATSKPANGQAKKMHRGRLQDPMDNRFTRTEKHNAPHPPGPRQPQVQRQHKSLHLPLHNTMTCEAHIFTHQPMALVLILSPETNHYASTTTSPTAMDWKFHRSTYTSPGLHRQQRAHLYPQLGALANNVNYQPIAISGSDNSYF